MTSLVLSDFPRVIFRCSKINRNRFLRTRKTIRSSRIIFIFIRKNTRTLPLIGKDTSPISKTTVSRYVRNGIRTRQIKIA
jgi:DNA primase large subunit